eukprot:7092984-Prymnesium_polylepis.1
MSSAVARSRQRGADVPRVPLPARVLLRDGVPRRIRCAPHIAMLRQTAECLGRHDEVEQLWERSKVRAERVRPEDVAKVVEDLEDGHVADRRARAEEEGAARCLEQRFPLGRKPAEQPLGPLALGEHSVARRLAGLVGIVDERKAQQASPGVLGRR